MKQLERFTITGDDVELSTRVTDASRAVAWGQFGRREQQPLRALQTEKWDMLFGSLYAWLENPAELEDDGISAPSKAVILRAYDIVNLIQAQASQTMPGLIPAPRIVPTGDGGIALQTGEGSVFQSLEIDADGTVELLLFHDAHLAGKIRILPPFKGQRT
jgi:hypothetical protein